MLLNYETVLVGNVCALVPYRPEHVARYHHWMQDPKLLEATASEPLSLDEEYDMQETWRRDVAKCTFIVLAQEKVQHGDYCDAFVEMNLASMVGDVNLFLSEEDNDDDGDENDAQPRAKGRAQDFRQAEIDIMIAETTYQRKGIGREAACLMMMYGAKNLRIRRFYCKIKDDNAASLALFEKLGFQQCGYATCFRELEMDLHRDSPEDVMKTLADLLGSKELRTLHCPMSEESNACGNRMASIL